MVADLALESEVYGEAGEVACESEFRLISNDNDGAATVLTFAITVLLGHIAVRLVQLQRLAQIVLQ